MATVAQRLPQVSSSLTWLRDFLKEELAPYPGRAGRVGRMILAATLVMIVCMTFQIPFAFQGAVYALMISRESSRATLQSGTTILLFTGIGSAYLLGFVRFFINSPLLHFLWIIGSFFLAFYVISAAKNYMAAVIFATMMAVGLPLWDRYVAAETSVEDTLWLCLATLIGVGITAVVELLFVRLRPGDEIVLPIAERLAAVENLLTSYTENRTVDSSIVQRVLRLQTLGTSLLRVTLRRSDYSPRYSVEMGGVAALVGRLVDLAATLTQFSSKFSASDQKRFQNLASNVASIRDDLTNRRIPGPVQFYDHRDSASFVPLLAEMEHTVALIPDAFADSQSIHEYFGSADEAGSRGILVQDALHNPEHLQFALKGTLAASLCYVIYNAIAWPGISTAVTTCLLTALTTIGSSRQKQLLRIAGAIVGGFVIGMGSQIFILPYLDSIAGFVVLFVAVTALACWFMTSSPRLSYFGFQVALAYYLINLSEFKMQISLEVARNRVVGILLGLFIMWLVFDQLWGAPAAVGMRRAFISNLRLLAQLAREPLSQDRKAAIAQSLILRETINANLDKVRALADGVLFEFGPSRERDLALRDRIRQWQPNLRMLFITRIVLWRYRMGLPGFELPKAIQPAQQKFDNCVAMALEGLADRMNGLGGTKKEDLKCAFVQFERAVQKALPNEQNPLTPQIQSFLVLSSRIAALAHSVQQEI